MMEPTSSRSAGRNGSFGLLIYYGTDNIGDEIQSLAARRFLDQIDYLIDRETLSSFTADMPDELAKVIFNGWFCHFPENFSACPSIDPLAVSMHVTPRARERFSDPKILSFLAANGAVGARDLDTLEFFRSVGLDAYFSGCLTLTLPRPDVEPSGNVVLNDVSPEVINHVAGLTMRNLLLTRHSGHGEYSPHLRLAKAESLLREYASAHAVVTTRLHCAMPCVAMETPVLLLNDAPDQERFAGLHEFVHSCSTEDYLAGRHEWHPERPPLNPHRHSILRHNLIRRARRFVDPDRAIAKDED